MLKLFILSGLVAASMASHLMMGLKMMYKGKGKKLCVSTYKAVNSKEETKRFHQETKRFGSIHPSQAVGFEIQA